MERLTRLIYGAKGPNWAVANLEHDSQEIIDRLAAYEETGLTPEDIEGILERGTPLEGGTAELMKKYLSIGSVDHLMELAHAEKDGRLVVLPEEEELTDEEIAEMTGYKCPVCARHDLCTKPGMRPLCGEIYDHFEPREVKETEDALMEGDNT